MSNDENYYSGIEETIARLISHGYYYLNQNELETLLDRAEDLIVILRRIWMLDPERLAALIEERAIRDKEKYR